MEKILKATQTALFAQDDELVLIPEFPLRKELTKKQIEDLEAKGQKPRKLSNKIDYLVVNKTRREIHAVELKTDNGSVKQSQVDYYKKDFKEKTVADLLAFLEEIIAEEGHHEKYDNLVRYMKKNGVETESSKVDYVTGEVIYLIPNEKPSAHRRQSTEEKLQDFQVISFEEIHKVLLPQATDDHLLRLFLEFIDNINRE